MEATINGLSSAVMFKTRKMSDLLQKRKSISIWSDFLPTYLYNIRENVIHNLQCTFLNSDFLTTYNKEIEAR